jgi:ATP-dependent Clp protease protease subunit
MTESTEPQTSRMSVEQQEAHARMLNAKAAVAEAEVLIKLEELKQYKDSTESSQMVIKMAREKQILHAATDAHHRTVRFMGQVTSASVKEAVDKLVSFHRIDAGCDIKFIIDSPGGGITEGLALYDTLLWLRREGHHITTIANGMAASMGGILLQAGTTRVMTAESSMLIHEASFGAGGSMGTVEDQVEYVKMLQDRLLGILAERSTMTKRAIKQRWARKNWWIMSPDALKLGFVDEIR